MAACPLATGASRYPAMAACPLATGAGHGGVPPGHRHRALFSVLFVLALAVLRQQGPLSFLLSCFLVGITTARKVFFAALVVRKNSDKNLSCCLTRQELLFLLLFVVRAALERQ